MSVLFLKGSDPEYKHPAVAVFPDGDDVPFTVVFKRLDSEGREALNVELMQISQESLRMRQELESGALDALDYAERAKANNQRMIDLCGQHLLRCEDLQSGSGAAVSWSGDIFQMMIRSPEYAAGLGRALREFGVGKKVEAQEAKNSTTSATASTGATVVELPRPA